MAIPEPWATELQQYRAAVGDTTAAKIPTHITLVPPTEISAETLEDVETHLEAAADEVASFSVHLRGTGTFRPVSQVVFVQVAEGISACERLEAAIRTSRPSEPLRFPYHPHVTIAHNIDDASLDRAYNELSGFECQFTVDRFALYLHDDVDGWVPRETFDLGPGPR